MATGLPPSIRQGYARGPGESAFPQLWDGLHSAWIAELGSTGRRLYDASGRSGIVGTFQHATATEFGYYRGNFGLVFGTTQNAYINLGNIPNFQFSSNVIWTVCAHIMVGNTSDDDRAIIAKWPTTTNRQFLLRTDQGTAPTRIELYTAGSALLVGTASVIELDTPYLVCVTNSTVNPRFRVSIFSAAGDLLNAATGENSDNQDLTGDVTFGGRHLNDAFVGLHRGAYFYDQVVVPDGQLSMLARDFLAPFRLRRPIFAAPAAPPTGTPYYYNWRRRSA